jgi:hypothetical protein
MYRSQLTVTDMNDAVNLGFYIQIIRFQLSSKEEESLFQSPDLLQRKAIERWAKSLGLEYEYDSVRGRARVGDLDVPLKRKDGSTQTDHPEERVLADKAGDEDGTLGDDSRGETTPLFSPGELGGEKITNQISDGETEIQGLQPDAKSSQNASKNEMSDSTWSTIHQAEISESKLDDTSFISPARSSADTISSETATLARIERIDDTRSTIENFPVSSIVNPTTFIPGQNAPDPTPEIPHLYPQPMPIWNFTDGPNFPGSLLWAQMQPIFSQPTKDLEEALQLVEEKSARSAAASARFLHNRKVKEEKKAAHLDALEQNIADLERRLRDMEAEKAFYRFERDRFRDVVLRIPRLRYLAIPSAKL